MAATPGVPFLSWLGALEQRHLARLTFRELRRGVQAVSTWYVEERRPERALDGAAKRAAFALYFAPLHFLATAAVIDAVGAAEPPAPERILDLGCGTGPAGAAWAMACREPRPPVTGIEHNPWAVEEAAWTYGRFGLRGRATRGDLARWPALGAGSGIVAAYAVNEQTPEARADLLERLLAAGRRDARVLVVEPLARSAAPWWDAWAAAFSAAGGRADVWRFAVELPAPLEALDRAAGLDHRELGARSLYLGRAG